MKCDCCESEFEFTEDPANAFIGCVEGDNGKAAEGEVILCKKCYYYCIMGHIPLRPWLFSYPMARRAKHIPPGADLPRNAVPGTYNYAKSCKVQAELDMRTAFAKALDMAPEDIPAISWVLKSN